MNEEIVQQILAELLSALEPLETQSEALAQFLKAKGIATDEELAPFLEQAGNRSNIRWRAVRVRTAALISSAMKPAEQSVETHAAENPNPAKVSTAEPRQGEKQAVPPRQGTQKREPESVPQNADKAGDEPERISVAKPEADDREESRATKPDSPTAKEAPKEAA